jgi:AraC-like DNA-binding protein
MDARLTELRRLAARAENRRTETGIPRVAMVRGTIPEHALATVYEPMVNVLLSGSKTMTVGDRVLRYDPATYFVMSVDLPAIGKVRPASDGTPYLAISLTLEPARIASLLADLPAEERALPSTTAFSVADMTPELLDAWLRMLRLMERPSEIPALAPLYEREILFRVLQGPLGGMLRAIATPGTAVARVDRAIRWLREHFAEPPRIERLAKMAALSPSAFHRQFKAVTALSPLQYQKQVRLLHARAQLVAGEGNVTAVAYRVGYASPNQFSREYARFFGLPPARDAVRRRARSHGS